MKNPDAKIPHTRRSFMAQSACSAMGLTGIVSTIAHLKLLQGALANSISGITDYKALIVLFNFGGTDTNNVLIPGPSHPARDDAHYGLPAGGTGSRGVLNLPASNQSQAVGEQAVALTLQGPPPPMAKPPNTSTPSSPVSPASSTTPPRPAPASSETAIPQQPGMPVLTLLSVPTSAP